MTHLVGKNPHRLGNVSIVLGHSNVILAGGSAEANFSNSARVVAFFGVVSWFVVFADDSWSD